MKFAIISLAFFASSLAQAAILSCTYLGEIKVFYDKSTKYVFKKNGPTFPTKPVLSPENHCMSGWKGSITSNSTPWSNGGESTRYKLSTIMPGDGSLWDGFAEFSNPGDGTAQFACRSAFGTLELRLSNCETIAEIPQ